METIKQKITGSGKKPPVFKKKGHKYTKDKEQYTSVTKFVHSFFTPFDTKGISKYVAQARRKKGEKVTAAQVKKEWNKIAEAGSTTHKQIEEFIVDSKSPADVKAKSGVMFLEEHGLVNDDEHFLFPELMVWSDEHKLCGTSDLVVQNNDYSITIVDWKTNKSINTRASRKGIQKPTEAIDDCNYMHYVLQLSTYAYIIETELDFKIKTLILVHLKDGMYVKYEIPYLKETVEAMIQWKHQNKL